MEGMGRGLPGARHLEWRLTRGLLDMAFAHRANLSCFTFSLEFAPPTCFRLGRLGLQEATSEDNDLKTELRAA
jgi:hypothetical protein